MSKQANTKAIGIFVLAGLALVAAAIIIFGSGRFFITKDRYIAFFQGSVQGLKVGAPVMFRGVRVGQVTKIVIYEEPQEQSFEIPVFLELERDNFHRLSGRIENIKQHVQNLIKRGMRAQLGLQSIVTGNLIVNFDIHPDTPARFVGKMKNSIAQDLIEIPTIPSKIERLEKTGEEVTKSLHYFKQTMKDVRDVAGRVNEDIQPLIEDLVKTLKDAQRLIRNLNAQVDPLATSLKQTSDAAGETFRDASKLIHNVDRQVEPLADDIHQALEAAHGSLKKAEATLITVNGVMEEGSTLRFEVTQTLEEMARAARALRILADYLERNPDALLRGKADVGER